MSEKDYQFIENNYIDYQLYDDFLGKIWNLKSKGMSITNKDCKNFFKIRHNLLHSQICDYLDLRFEKEKELSSFGITSKKTPDITHFESGEYYIIEFTVSNNLKTILKNKLDFTKYEDECEQFRKLGYKAQVYFVYISMDGNNDESITALRQLQQSLYIDKDPSQFISSIYSKMHYYHLLILRFFPELLNQYDDTDMGDVGELLTEQNNIDFYESVSQGLPNTDLMLSKFIILHKTKFIKVIKRMRSALKYKIDISFLKIEFYFVMDEDGITKDEIMLMLETRSPELSKFITVLDFDINDKTCPFPRMGAFEDEIREAQYTRVVDYTKLVDDFIKYERFDDTLINDKLSDDVSKVESNYLSELNNLQQSTYSYVIREKNPFTIHCFIPRYEDTPDELKTGNNLIDCMLSRVKEVKFKPTKISRDFNPTDIDNVNKELTVLSSKLKKINYYSFNKIKRMNNKTVQTCGLFDDSLLNDYVSCRNKFKEKMIEEGRKTADRLIHTIPMAEYKTFWAAESDFMRLNQGRVSIYKNDISNMGPVKDKYLDFYNLIMSNTGLHEPDLLGNTEPLALGTMGLLKGMREEIESGSKIYTDTIYYKTLLSYSKIAYSVMYYSMVKANKNDFFIENCGISNMFLIVKGGKKILSNKKSRMFKIIINIEPEMVDIYNKGSYKVHQYNGKYYLNCPWRSYSIKMLKHLNELPYKFANYFNCSYIESNLPADQYLKFITTRVLLSLSNKRKMEVWSSSFRYIYFNSLGTHSSILDLLPSMAMLDIDELAWLYQRLFATHYIDIYNYAQEGKLYDMITSSVFDNYDLCAEKFQEALLMVRADFNNQNEYLRNMKSILDGSIKFKSQIVIDNIDTKENCLENTKCILNSNYSDEIRKNDYTFSPQLIYAVGSYFGDKLSESITRSELSSKFDSIFRSDFSVMANSRGLRSPDNIFWGQKGFDVIEQFKDKEMNVKDKCLEAVSKDFINSTEFNKFIRSSDINFIDFYTDKVDKLRYDQASKDQWGDKREVFSQDMITKALQNPIEKYFMFLSKFCPNEMIHMKSSIRPRFMHKQVFEETSEDTNIVYATMDCSKWAPESNNWKYFYFVKGLSHVLPENFVKLFDRLWFLMFNKYVIFKKGYVKKLLSNGRNQHYMDVLILNKEMSDEHYNSYLKGYNRRKLDSGEKFKEMLKPVEDFEIFMVKRNFDFVMGMYNSLSSLLHAASQMFFSDYISPRFNTHCKFYAHSDDSAGRLVSKKLSNIYKTFSIYERFQRALNHKLSKKKSKLCNNSLEMISIMYYKKRFIPTTHKFITQISYDPSGEGWFSDISSVVSKVVDVHVNGGTYTQMYSTMLIQSELLRKSYSLSNSSKLSTIALVFGGVFNLHPIHLVLLGSSAQETILDILETDEYKDVRVQLYKSFTGSYCPTKPIDLTHRYPVYTQHGNMLMEAPEDSDMLKAIAALDIQTGLGKSIVYYNKLKDSSFRMSLTGNEADKLYINMLFYKTKVVTNIGTFQFRKVVNTVLSNSLIGYKDRSDALSVVPKNIYETYMMSVESVYFNYDFTVASTKSCKPITYDTVTLLDMNLDNESFKKILALVISPKIEKYIANSEKYLYLLKWVMASLPGSDEDKIEIIKKYQRSDFSRFRSTYMYMPSGIITESLPKFITYSILYCTKRYRVSESNPNLYSVTKFDKESSVQPHLQHMAIINMVLSSNSKIEIIQMCKETLQGCARCKDILYDQLESYLDFFDHKVPMFETMLPIATYERSQKRSVNGWFGDSDFTLYYMGCKVKHKLVNCNYKTIWSVFDISLLHPLYVIYKIFCNTRSIPTERPSYLRTDRISYMVGFTDISTPNLTELDSYEMALPFSSVEICNISPTIVSRDSSGKVHIDGDEVDFNIYNLTNVSKKFIEDHNLTDLRDLIHNTKGLTIGLDILIDNFTISKISKILLTLDEFYNLNNIVKSSYTGLLGSDFSFTKALFEADKRGITNYKTMNKGKIDSMDFIESQYLGHLPLLDLVDSVSFFRVSVRGKNTIMKVVKGMSLNSDDMSELIKLRDKLGAKACLNSITLFKVGNEINDVAVYSRLSRDLRFGLFCTLLKLMFDVDFNTNNIVAKSILDISKRRFFNLIFKGLKRRDYKFVSDIFARGILFSNLVDKRKFWDYIKDEPLLPLLNYGTNRFSFFYGCTEVTLTQNKKIIERLDEINFPILRRFERGFFSMDDYGKPEGESDYEVGIVFNKFEEIPYTFEDYLLDDVEDGLDEEDMEEREWSGEAIKIFIYSSSDMQYAYFKSVCNVESFTCYCNFRYICIPWLGYPHMFKEDINGEIYYVTYYDGTARFSSKPLESLSYKYTVIIEDNDILKTRVESFKELRQLTDLSPIVSKFKKDSASDINKLRGLIEEFCHQNQLDITRDILDRYMQILMPGVVDPGFSISDIIQQMTTGFDNSVTDTLLKVADDTRKKNLRNNDVLPGFSTHTNDNELLSEIKAIFPATYHKILQGHLNLSRNVRRNLEADLNKILVEEENNDKKMLAIFYRSLLLDSVECDNNDTGFLEHITEFILKSKTNNDNLGTEVNTRQAILNRQMGAKLNYENIDIW